MFLDIALGILGSYLISMVFKAPFTLVVALGGVIFSILPDFDALIQLFKERSIFKIDHNHRDYIHHPLIFLVIGTILIIFNPFWGTLFTILTQFHFLHDSMGVGWGIRWLYPFSRKYFKFFSTPKGDAYAFSVAIWTKEEQDAVDRELGDRDWMKNIYLKPSPTVILETLALVAAIIFLIFKL